MNRMLFILNSTVLTLDFNTGLDWEDRSNIKRAIMEDDYEEEEKSTKFLIFNLFNCI